MDKKMLSFYIDDTNPYGVSPELFREFLDFAEKEGIAGESSVILGIRCGEHGLLSEAKTDDQRTFLNLVQRASEMGIDAHMELFTHGGRFDFEKREIPEGVIHEGLWIHTADISVEEYEAYFNSILAEADRVGLKYTGMTWPGCGCQACMSVYRVLDEEGKNVINPNVYQALLNLAREDRFKGKTVTCFVSEELEGCQAQVMAEEGEHKVYDLPPNAGDRFMRNRNGKRVAGDPDYYISEDGASGVIADAVRSDLPYSMFYTHWWAMNPATPGWEVFTTTIKRINRFLGDQIEWARASEVCERLGI